MKVKKYVAETIMEEDIQARMKHYQVQASGFFSLLHVREFNPADKMRSGLLTMFPLAAASLSPFVLKAQCDIPGSGQTTTCPLPNTAKVDLDGGGYDLLFQNTGLGFRAAAVAGSGIQFAHYDVGPYAYFLGYVNGALIDANSGSFGTVPAAGFSNCSVTVESYAYLDYEATGRGGWNGLVDGTRYLGIIKDNRVGFVEITYNDNTNDYTVGDFGLASETIATFPEVPAGDCETLPVSLVFFRAEIVEEEVLLHWQTATEINNEGFEIQRSTDGIHFYKIGWVDGVGNAHEPVSYTFEDHGTEANTTYYYRFKQIDFDGKSEFSPTVSIVLTKAGYTGMRDFAPNPIREDFAHLRIDSGRRQQASVEVFDAVGQRIFEKQTELIQGLHTIRLDLSAATAGTYFVRLHLENGSSQFKRLIIAR